METKLTWKWNYGGEPERIIYRGEISHLGFKFAQRGVFPIGREIRCQEYEVAGSIQDVLRGKNILDP